MRERYLGSIYTWLVGLSVGVLILLAFFLLGTSSDRKGRGTETEAVAALLTPIMTPLITPITYPYPVMTVYPTYIEPSPTSLASPQTSPTTEITPQSTPMYAEERLVGEGDFGFWKFSAVRQRDGQIRAGVRYKGDTLDDLFTRAQINRELAAQVAARGGEAEVVITFRSYVEPDQFRTWARSYGLKPEWSMIRYINGAGDSATFDMGGTERDPLPRAVLDDVLQQKREDAQRKPEQSMQTMKGVFFTQGKVSADKLVQIVNDPLVFIADVTPNVVRQELLKAGVPGAEQARVGIGMADGSPFATPFWSMEHKFGLDKFQK